MGRVVVESGGVGRMTWSLILAAAALLGLTLLADGFAELPHVYPAGTTASAGAVTANLEVVENGLSGHQGVRHRGAPDTSGSS